MCSIGSYFPFSTTDGGPKFAAIVIAVTGRFAQLQWYAGNEYGRGKKLKPAATQFEKPVERCMQAMALGKELCLRNILVRTYAV